MVLRTVISFGALLGSFLLSNSGNVGYNSLKISFIVECSTTVDTIKRNDFVVYNVTKDTLAGGMNIAVQNLNIQGKYIVQYFNLEENTVIANYYPEMLASIKIVNNGKQWFDQSFFKKDLPESPITRYNNKVVLKELSFTAYDPERKEFIFIAIAHVPNTDFICSYEIKVFLNGKHTISYIGEAGD